jgi:hypothetical protein
MINDEQFMAIKCAINSLETKGDYNQIQLDKIAQHLEGNGNRGLLDRMTVIEEKILQITGLVEKNQSNINELEKIVYSLADSIKIHTVDESKHTFKGLFLKKDLILYSIIAFIFLHTLISDGGILFQFVKKLVGL